ncbi:outer membrane protein assembly factor BamC [Comamonas sp. Y33R10-2]|uniref:outer membrane protein assembly factor BamC n=1 Tax=Comamonas sp. Y33R10-2 TaxID=2853257 RepID=UPI001C5CBDB1|nr:outer membrane protein assembly factor BamC [Comamonas sp. Y33R10-2]QXZ09677.1 outer membrane protein assembly factor BamC [Comamonas sp. Y33R10-2]
MKQQTARLGLLSIALGLSACSTTFQETKVDYKSAGKSQAPSLEVPPDLTQLSQDSRYNVPGGVVSAAAIQANAKTAKPADNNTAANKIGDVRIERDGAEHWLVVDRAADKLWEPTRDFWLENGFIYSMEDRQLGILETDWAENRAKLPQDIIRKSLGKVFDSLYSTSERDKFRTRLEREPDGKTRIFVTHRGMQEVYTNERKDNTIWQPRARDPELETEFLRRIMIKLGVSEEQASAVAKADKTAAVTSSGARMDSVNGVPTLQLQEGFDRAWRRVGVALDRTGFTVEDRDRSRGIYFVRYVDPNAKPEAKGFFSKIFSRGKEAAAPVKYQILVKADGNKSQVSVLNEQGQPDSSANGQRIVRILTDEMK